MKLPQLGPVRRIFSSDKLDRATLSSELAIRCVEVTDTTAAIAVGN